MKKLAALVVIILLTVICLGLRDPLIYDLDRISATGISFQKAPEGMVSIDAKSCGSCHQAIYAEWRTTMHAAAYTDPLFQAYWKKDGYAWSCLNCHTPLENQLQQRVIQPEGGLFSKAVFTDNGGFDPVLQREGVTCVACHLRDGVIYGPYRAGELDTPHPVAFDRRFLSEQICLECHEVPARAFSLLQSEVCGTGSEWRDGPYAKRGYRCQTCHMPAITRPLLPGGKKRAGRRHLWRGGHSPQQVAKALTIGATLLNTGRIKVNITNSGAGHRFPTGDPDREVTLTARLVDGKGKVLDSAQLHIRRLILWKPVMIEFSDNRIAPLETRTLLLTIPDGQRRKGLRVEVEGVYQILSERARRKLESHYGLKAYPAVRYTFLKEIVTLQNAAAW